MQATITASAEVRPSARRPQALARAALDAMLIWGGLYLCGTRVRALLGARA